MKVGGEFLIIEHVTQEDQIEGLYLRTNHVVSEKKGRLQAVQLTVHLGCNGCNCNTQNSIFSTLPCKCSTYDVGGMGVYAIVGFVSSFKPFTYYTQLGKAFMTVWKNGFMVD